MLTTTLIAWVLAACLVGLGGYGAWRALFRDCAKGRRRCPRCWYDMTGVSGLTCPECGRVASAERRLLRTRRHKLRFAACLLLILIGSLLPWGDRVRLHGWAAVPTPILFAAIPFSELGDAHRTQLVLRIDKGLSPLEVKLLDRSLALAIRYGRNKPMAAGCPDQLIWNKGYEAPHSTRALVDTVFDSKQPDQARELSIYTLSMMTMGDPSYVDFWKGVLTAGFGPGPRATAAAMLGHMEEGAASALEVLVKALDDPDPGVVEQAAFAVGRLRAAAKPALPRLIRILESNNGRAASNVAFGLTYMGSDALPAIPALIEEARTNQSRAFIIIHLGAIGPAAVDAVPQLLTTAEDSSYRVRYESLVAVALILHHFPDHPRRGEAVAAMLNHLDDPHKAVQGEMLRALFLIDWNPGERAGEMRRRGDALGHSSAVWGMLLESRAKGTLPAAEEALIDELRKGVSYDRSEEQEAAIEAIGHLRCERSLPVLETFCADRRQIKRDAESQMRYGEARRSIRQIRTGVRTP